MGIGKMYKSSSQMPLSKRQYKTVQKIIHKDAEKKYVIGHQVAFAAAIANTTEIATNLTPLARGDGVTQMIGSVVKISRFELRLALKVAAEKVCRLLVVQAKEGTLSDQNILTDGTDGPFKWVDWKNADGKILFDKNYVGRDGATSTTYDISITNKNFRKGFNPSLRLDSTSSTVPENSLYLVYCGSDATSSGSILHAYSNFTYTDM